MQYVSGWTEKLLTLCQSDKWFIRMQGEVTMCHTRSLSHIGAFRKHMEEKPVEFLFFSFFEKKNLIFFSVKSTGWLEPLLGRIAEDKRHVVAPVIGNINDDTLQFAWFNPDQIHVGKFDWDLTFNWMPIPSYVKDKMNSKVDAIRLVSDFNRIFCRVVFLPHVYKGLTVAPL